MAKGTRTWGVSWNLPRGTSVKYELCNAAGASCATLATGATQNAGAPVYIQTGQVARTVRARQCTATGCGSLSDPSPPFRLDAGVPDGQVFAVPVPGEDRLAPIVPGAPRFVRVPLGVAPPLLGKLVLDYGGTTSGSRLMIWIRGTQTPSRSYYSQTFVLSGGVNTLELWLPEIGDAALASERELIVALVALDRPVWVGLGDPVRGAYRAPHLRLRPLQATLRETQDKDRAGVPYVPAIYEARCDPGVWLGCSDSCAGIANPSQQDLGDGPLCVPPDVPPPSDEPECSVDADCRDLNVCDGQETCSAGRCTSGTPLVCQSTDPCSRGVCMGTVGCVDIPLPDGAICSDGIGSTVGDLCLGGVCSGVECTSDAQCAAEERCDAQGRCVTDFCLPGSALCGHAALDLDGSGAALQSPRAQTLGASQPWSLGLWVRPANGRHVSPGTLFEAAPANDSDSGIAVQLEGTAGVPNAIRVRAHDRDGVRRKEYRVASALPQRVWSHVLVTWSGSELRVYINGESAAVTRLSDEAIAMDDRARIVSLGGGVTPDENPARARLGHVALWSRALDASSIREIFRGRHEMDLRSPYGSYQDASALVHYWRPGEDPGTPGLDHTAAVPLDLAPVTGSGTTVADSPHQPAPWDPDFPFLSLDRVGNFAAIGGTVSVGLPPSYATEGQGSLRLTSSPGAQVASARLRLPAGFDWRGRRLLVDVHVTDAASILALDGVRITLGSLQGGGESEWHFGGLGGLFPGTWRTLFLDLESAPNVRTGGGVDPDTVYELRLEGLSAGFGGRTWYFDNLRFVD